MIPCDICEHHRGEGKCNAFPDGIPDDILYLYYDHRKEYPGDNGIRFKLAQICYYCANYTGQGKCLAFPKGIPEVILLGKFKHNQEYQGDKGYRFKPSLNLLRRAFEATKSYKRLSSLPPEKKKQFIEESKAMFHLRG